MITGVSGKRYKDNTTQTFAQQSEATVRSQEMYELWREGVEARRARIGLVFPAITHRVTVKVYRGMVAVKFPGQLPPQLRGVKRGAIHSFSSRSRKRMMDALAQWKLAGKAFFITLTYHEGYGDDFKRWKSDMDKFLKRFHRKFPGVSGIWRLEFQQRGAPHYHMLISGVNADYAEMVKFVTTAWAEIAHQESEHKGKYATNVRSIVSRRHAMHYASKYMGKESVCRAEDETGEIIEMKTGRFWAVFGQFDRDPVVAFSTSVGQAQDWRQGLIVRLSQRGSRFAERFAEQSKFKGYSVYGFGLDDWPGSDVENWRDFTRWCYEMDIRGD